MKQTGFLFWQPKKDLFKKLLLYKHGKSILLFLNYLIWPFLFFCCFLLIRQTSNLFWQILISIASAEVIERFSKKKFFWLRPICQKKDKLPKGLVKKWYQTGSFPSGHTSKAVYFFLLILQHQSFNPLFYLLFTTPLLVFRVLVGFHYPIDILGGLVIGSVLWLLTNNIIFPDSANLLIKTIFDTVFFVK